jgi:hypothetical protein
MGFTSIGVVVPFALPPLAITSVRLYGATTVTQTPAAVTVGPAKQAGVAHFACK